MSPTVEKSSARNIDVSYKPSVKKAIYPNSIIKKEMSIDPDELGHVLGKAMSNADRLKEMYEVEITLLFKGSSQIIISLEGLAEDVFAAKRDIEECIPLTTRFFIEKEYIATTIGRNGEKIQALEKYLNVKIRINQDGEVVVTGSQIGIDASKRDIEKGIQRCKTGYVYNYKEEFYVPPDLIGVIAGKNRSNLKRIESTHGVQVFLPSVANGKSEILVKGPTAEKVSAAKREITARAYEYQEDFSVPSHLFGYITGKKGSNLKRIESIYDVHVQLPSCNKKGNAVVVKGWTAENVSAAKKDILESLPDSTLSFDVEKRFERKIIGRGGETIRRLRKEYGVKIGLSKDGKVHISGSIDNAEAARDAIISIISQQSNRVD